MIKHPQRLPVLVQKVLFRQLPIRFLVAGVLLREAPFNESPPLFGHCPNSNYTPPRTQTGTLGHFFREEFSKFKRAFA